MMKRNEKIIIILLLAISLILFLFFKFKMNNNAIVSVTDENDNVLLTFNIYENNYYEVQGKYGVFHIEVKNGKCRAVDVECPNQICVHTGWISIDNPIPIICLPNGIVVQIYEPY